MKSFKNIIIGILVIAVIFFVYDMITRKVEVIEVPIHIRIPVPSKEGTSDTVYKPLPIKIITRENPLNQELSSINKKLLIENDSLLEKYKRADSINKSKQYQDAIAIKEYKETFKDTFQTIDVYTKTRGELLEQSISYKTEKYYIDLDTTIKVKVKGKFKVLGQMEVGSNIIGKETFTKIVAKPSIIFQNSKNNGLSISVDTKGIGYLGVVIKF